MLQYFFEMPSEERSAKRGDPLEFFGFADSAYLFTRITNTAGERQFEWIRLRTLVDKTRSEVTTRGASSFT